jgi:hypothetical protein
MIKRNWIQKLFGYCPCCGKWFRIVRTERRLTRYIDDADNWLTACKACQNHDDEYWSAMWEDYYGSI